MLMYADKPLFVITGSQGAILHVLTGVKRLASDNTAGSGTPSLDNYITPVLHCFHSLPVILLKSQWLESQWQRDEWQRGSRRRNTALSMSDCFEVHEAFVRLQWSCIDTQWNALLNARIPFGFPDQSISCLQFEDEVKSLQNVGLIFLYSYLLTLSRYMKSVQYCQYTAVPPLDLK